MHALAVMGLSVLRMHVMMVIFFRRAMEKLATKNKRLRKAHSLITEIVLRLMNTDLVRQIDKWKQGLGEITQLVDGVAKEEEREGKKETRNSDRAWRVHWDYQLCKALEYQYKLGLESCHETLPQIETKLVFRNKKLVLDPSFEDLRSNYYKALKKFILIPQKFPGVGQSDIFKQIGERNSKGLSTVFTQAERLFKRLSDTVEKYSPWVALGSIDIDDCVELNLREVEDWEANFKKAKDRRREMDKLNLEEKVDCITINCEGVKSSAEDLLKQFTDALSNSLRKSAQADIEELDKFVKESLDALSSMPQTLEEIALSTERWQAVNELCSEKRETKFKVEEKGRLLKMHKGETLDVVQLNKAWDELELRLSAHEKTVEEQKDRLKGMIEKRIKDFETEVIKFSGRWKGSKPDASGLKDRETAAQMLDEVRNWDKEFKDLSGTNETIKKECKHFDMQCPDFPELEELREDVTRTTDSWSLYEKFKTEMEGLAAEDWMSIRERLYVIEDALGKWSQTIKGMDIDVVVRFLHSEVERLKKNVPYLKFVKGDAFTQDHWQQLFKMLEMPKGISKKELTLQHMLDASDLVVSKMEAIKDLQARATAELTIQEAFDELTKWKSEAVFTVIEQTDFQVNVREVSFVLVRFCASALKRIPSFLVCAGTSHHADQGVEGGTDPGEAFNCPWKRFKLPVIYDILGGNACRSGITRACCRPCETHPTFQNSPSRLKSGTRHCRSWDSPSTTSMLFSVNGSTSSPFSAAARFHTSSPGSSA